MKHLNVLFLATVLSGICSAQTVTTQFGNVQGQQNGGVTEFLGIPYAKPPVGNLRWKAPENPDPWATTLLATAFAPECPQKEFQQGDTVGTVVGSEDCLYLNIWTPQAGTQNKPVMFFIHGGGNQQGSANEISAGTQLYYGKHLAERGDVVVVTIQYRLGPLGFLVHPGLEAENAGNTSGNYAVMDQILALNWVKNNIANFGGDPNNVMIFGESAGGVNVGNLLVSPLSAGLFHKACIESAGPAVSSYTASMNKGMAYVDSFTVTGTDSQKIAYLRSLSADSLMHFETSPLQGGVVQMNWGATLDGVVFPDYPMNIVQAAEHNHVPLMIGSNSEEMSLSAPPVVYPATVNAFINSYVPSGLQATAHSLYPNGSNTTEARQSLVNILTDLQFTATTRRVAECVSTNQLEAVWRYFFTFKHTVSQLAAYGSYHGMELFYVFNTWEDATLGSGSFFHAGDDSTQQIMLQYWTNFARTGNPNGTGLATWPQYSAATDCYMELKATPNGTQCGLRTAQSDLWDQVINWAGCTSSLGLNEDALGSIRVFPNPATNAFTVVSDSEQHFQLLDASGKLIVSGVLVSGENTLSTDRLGQGIYLLKFGNGEISRLVVQ